MTEENGFAALGTRPETVSRWNQGRAYPLAGGASIACSLAARGGGAAAKNPLLQP